MPTKTKRKKKKEEKIFYAYAPSSRLTPVWFGWIRKYKKTVTKVLDDGITNWREEGFSIKKVKIEVVE